MAHCTESSDLFIVGSEYVVSLMPNTRFDFSRDIRRLNLEQGQFMAPLTTEADAVNCCEFNAHHQLFVCGTSETTVEAWDYRSNERIGILDCAVEELNEEASIANE